MYRPDYRLSAPRSRQIFAASSLELTTPKTTPVESRLHRHTRGKFASYSNEEFVGDEHSFNSAAGRLKVGRDWEAEDEEKERDRIKEEKPLNASRTGFASKRNGKLNEGIRFYLFYSWNN